MSEFDYIRKCFDERRALGADLHDKAKSLARIVRGVGET